MDQDPGEEGSQKRGAHHLRLLSSLRKLSISEAEAEKLKSFVLKLFWLGNICVRYNIFSGCSGKNSELLSHFCSPDTIFLSRRQPMLTAFWCVLVYMKMRLFSVQSEMCLIYFHREAWQIHQSLFEASSPLK